MDGARNLIREIHRRSLWQVLSIYLVGSWGALQVVESITENAGLPDWVTPFALVLLVLGLPVVLATAFVQEGIGGRDDGTATDLEPAASAAAVAIPHPGDATAPPGDAAPAGRRHLLTWRNALLGGGAGFAVLGVAVAAYMLMWSTGVGPVGSLVAQGVLDAREPIVLAEFENLTSDSTLGDVVTEALRVDLLESPVLTVVEPTYVREVLRRMQRDEATQLTAELAHEVAVREGLKGVIQGEIGSVGGGYVLTARIAAAEDGASLAAFRETATDADGLIDAIDGLSRRIREKAGESLRSIRAGEPLGDVTTSSLEALRKYTQGVAVADRGDLERGIELMEEAIAQDSTFAMAWRKLGVLLGNVSAPVDEARHAATRAHELRDRLSDRERYQAIAYYHQTVTRNLDQAVRAYRNVLDAHPDDRVALNNLGLILLQREEGEQALELFERAVSGAGETYTAHFNRVTTLRQLGRFDAADSALAVFAQRYPGHDRIDAAAFRLALARGEMDGAADIARRRIERLTSDRQRTEASHELSIALVGAGRLRDAEGVLDEIARVDPSRRGRVVVDLARIRGIARRDAAGGLTYLREAYAEPPLSEVPLPPIDVFLELAAFTGDGALFERTLEEVRPRVPEDASTEEVEALVTALRGHLAFAQERWAEAVRGYETARGRVACGACYRLEMGLALLELGRLDEARESLEAWLLVGGSGLNSMMLDPVALEALGRVHEAHGDTAAALEAYGRFTDRWTEPDAELRPLLEGVRARVRTLGG